VNKSAEINIKTERVVKMLAAEKLGGVLLTSQPNFSWLTAGGTNGIDNSREPGAGALIVRDDGKRFVLASRIEMPRLLAEELNAEEFEPIEFPWEEEKSGASFVADLARSLMLDGGAIGSDLPLQGAAVPLEGAVARCRYSLIPCELDRFRQLGREAGQAVGDLIRGLAPGETEKQVARKVAKALGAYDIHAVVNLIAADDRISRFRHPVPTELKWEKVLMVVVCARRDGLIASLTRIVCNGAMPEALRRKTIATANVNARILDGTRVDATGSSLYDIAAKAYAAEGFEGEERLHHQGGACGYRTRDWVAHPASSESVQPNQAFAWNPSITGSKIEETCILTDDGIEPITITNNWPYISSTIEGREYLSPDVLVL
jgi:Xaa-Pro aminopeptidase